MSTLWEWISDFRERAAKAGDEPRVRLSRLHGPGFDLRETDPDRALAIYEEGRQLAEALAEPWWERFYDHWRLVAKMSFQRDYRGVLELAVQSVLEVRKSSYNGLPFRTDFHVHLIDAYMGIDPHGYADAIRQAQDLLAMDGGGGDTICYTLLGSRREFALAVGDLDRAERTARESLALLDAAGNRHYYNHFGSFAYDALCEVAWRRGDWTALTEAAPVGEELAVKVGHRMEMACARMWQALAVLHGGDRPTARRLYRQSLAVVSQLRMPPEPKYFDAVCGFLEKEGDVEGQLPVRDRELATLWDKGRFDAESLCRLKRCRLLARLGRPLEEEMAAAREAARKLRIPAPRLVELDRIERGESGDGL